MRLCIKCNTEKDESEFYYLSNKKTGTCIECTCKRVRENRKEKIDYYREFDKNRSTNPDRIKSRTEYQKNNPDKFRSYKKKYALNNPEKIHESQSKYKKNNPEKYKATSLLNNNKKKGKVISKPCIICGDIKSQAHHEDYNKPLEVIWLCDKHHKELHKNRRIK